MVSLLIALARLWIAIRKAWCDPAFRFLAALTLALLWVGTWVFHKVEGWTYLDSFYFSASSLATVGYGDYTPKTSAGKLLTVFYIFAGFGLLVALLTLFADSLIQSVWEDREKLNLQLMQAREKKVPSGAAPLGENPTQPPATAVDAHPASDPGGPVVLTKARPAGPEPREQVERKYGV